MIKNDSYDDGMTMLGGKETPPFFDAKSLVSSIAAELVSAPPELGSLAEISANLLAALFQDDDAHDTCSLTACLNPLHPGPCKGWKGTLFKTAPGAWHSLEAAKVDKANAARIKKIEALKAQGKPIPKKLLTPIVAKPHPHAGQTANKAGGDAHVAGQEVTQNAGVKPSTPGKVTLGQAVKTLAAPKPVQKGPKGKKPTVASKGIAFVIAQEKVTPQYKLDKAAAITPEQWNALPEADKSTIRGELAKIKIDGFGPQQKKADELLDKLKPEGIAIGALKPGTPGTITTPKGKTYQVVSLKDLKDANPPKAETPKAPEKPAVAAEVKQVLEKAKAEAPKVTEPDNPTPAGQATAALTLANAIFGQQNTPMDTLVAGFEKMAASGKPIQEHPGFKGIVNTFAQAALKKASADKMPGLGHGDNDAHIGTFNKEIADHIAQGKPGLPPLVKKMAEHHEASKPENVKKGIEQAAKDAAAKVSPPTKLSEVATPATAIATSKPTSKHVQHAIDMAEGKAPGASWAKNQLAAYQGLSGAEFDALPQKTQDKIVSDLKKGAGKFLDPKKVVATKQLLAKFGHGDGKPSEAPKVAGPAKPLPNFAQGLKDPDLSERDAKKIAAATAPKGHFLAAKDSAGLIEQDNPDDGEHVMAATDGASALVEQQTKIYTKEVLDKPEVSKAADALLTAAAKEQYAVNVWKAKASAYNKVSTTLASPSANLTPLQKASLAEYEKYLLSHSKPDTSMPKIDELKAATKAAQNDLAEKLHAALKTANAPAPAEMSNAQVADRTKELLGELAVYPKTNLSLKELQYAGEMGKAKANTTAAQYPPAVLSDPAVAAKLAALASVNTQINASNAEIGKLNDHIKQFHTDAAIGGVDKNGNPLTPADKLVIAKHAKLLESSHQHLYSTLEHNEVKQPAVEAQFHAAAKKAEEQLKPAGPVSLDQFDQDTIGEVYRGAWGKTATKAVTYGIKTYGTKTEMSNHPEYPEFKQELGLLQQLAGKVAVASGQAHTARMNVPLDDNGGMEAGPEKQAWLKAVIERDDLKSQFDKLHKQAQGRIDTIRLSVGLKKRALPKVDSPAVKTAAAESAYYKTGGYGKPLYGKPASAKQYLVAKVGSDLAVAHKTSGDKANEKAEKASATNAKLKAAMPAPKTHVKPPSSEKGDPNTGTAEKLGYHFTPKVAEGDQHSWPTSDKGAYVASPEALADLQAHLGNEDTKYGMAAQKEFKWSINNMEEKGGPSGGKKALYSYTGSGYQTVNNKLNSLPPGTQKTGSSTVTSIDGAFAASPPLEGDVILYRGFSSPESVFKSGKWNDVNVAGVEWSQRSYSSTSGSLGTAQSFAGYNGVVMRVIIPKEMKVKGINAKGGQHPGENEIILERGIRYRVVADYGKGPNDSRRYIDVMVVPSPYDKPE